jgi:rhamnosyltransferase
VLITYNPDYKLLAHVVNSIVHQVRTLYIVDNTPNTVKHLEDFSAKNIQIVYLNENMGIAYAQNIGIKKSLENQANYIVLSDQDTLFPENCIENMLLAFQDNHMIAALGPLYKDTNSENSNDGFYKNETFFYKKFIPTRGKYEVAHLMASGTMLNTLYLNDIGLMDEQLFIDWVDLEWCWRATKKGYKIIGDSDIVITHQLGDTIKKIGSREVGLRNPIRHYYITRNAFHLALRCKSLSIIYRTTLFFRAFRYILAYPLLSTPHLTHLRYVLLGFWHGIIGKLGKLQ